MQHVLNDLTLHGHTNVSIDKNPIQVAGKEAVIILSNGKGKNKLGMSLPWANVGYRTATFLEGGRAWTIKFGFFTNETSEGLNAYDARVRESQRMLSSFKFIK